MYTLSKADIDLQDDGGSISGDLSAEKSLVSTSSGVDTAKLIVNQPLTLSSMKQLMQLTSFDNIKPCFTVNVSSCWVRIIQAQKDRKHPQHLQHQDSEVSESTLSWRLQKTKLVHSFLKTALQAEWRLNEKCFNIIVFVLL